MSEPVTRRGFLRLAGTASAGLASRASAGLASRASAGLASRASAGLAGTASAGLAFVLGHAGARDAADALELAVRYENAWLGIHGQGVTQLAEMLRRTGGERLLFGSDWPFYQLAASLAKVLIATPGRPDLRDAVLRKNAERVLG